MYGDEIDEGEDRNDGLNALVIFFTYIDINRISNGLLVSTRTLIKECII